VPAHAVTGTSSVSSKTVPYVRLKIRITTIDNNTHQPDTPPIVICFATDSFERSRKKRRIVAVFEFCPSGNIPETSIASSEHKSVLYVN